jgi:hypothetical protein
LGSRRPLEAFEIMRDGEGFRITGCLDAVKLFAAYAGGEASDSWTKVHVRVRPGKERSFFLTGDRTVGVTAGTPQDAANKGR